MTFNNGEKIVVFRLLGFISTIVYALYIFLGYFEKAFRKALSESELNLITVILTVVYFGIILWPMVMKYHYISFTGDAKGITLRWYKTGLMPGDSKSIEIPAERYAGYEITRSFLGLYQYITLFQKIQNQRAGYSPVCINALSKEQRQKLINTLTNYKSVA